MTVVRGSTVVVVSEKKSKCAEIGDRAIKSVFAKQASTAYRKRPKYPGIMRFFGEFGKFSEVVISLVLLGA